MLNKISIRPYILKTVLFILLTAYSYVSMGQDSSWTRPPVTDKWKEYRKAVRSNKGNEMIELKSIIHDIVYDFRYATTNNFMNRPMYPEGTNTTYMRAGAIIGLWQVQQKLKEEGLGLKVFDAYRPFSVTVKFWELVHDDRYVANPSHGSGHNRGISIDLTIIRLADGMELNMGTGFDNFSDTAHQDFMQLPEEVLKNRAFLRSLMDLYGFKPLQTEWWHYTLKSEKDLELDDKDPNKGYLRSKAEGGSGIKPPDTYDILDIPFTQLAKKIRIH